MFSRQWMLGAIAAAVVLIGCSESSTATAPPAVATATQPSGVAPTPTGTVEASSGVVADVQADIQNFTHQDLTVQVGDTVVWTQQDGVSHTTTSGTPGSSDGVWDSGTLRQGESFSVTFTEAGTFAYFCSIHPSMTATVTVVGAGAPTPSPTATPPPAAAATAVPTATATQTPQPTVGATAAPSATSTPIPMPSPSPTATATAEPPPQGETIQATIQNFSLEDLTVRVGDTIVWTQQDQTTHTTTSGLPTVPDGIWDSGFLNNGQTFSFTLTEVGTFPFYCAIHPSMRATVTVIEAGSPDTTSPPPEATPASSGDDSGSGDIGY